MPTGQQRLEITPCLCSVAEGIASHTAHGTTMIAVARVADIDTADGIGMLQVTVDDMSPRGEVMVLQLSVSREDGKRRGTHRGILVRLVGIAGHVSAVVGRQAEA